MLQLHNPSFGDPTPPTAKPAALIDAVTNTWNLLRMLDTARSSWNMNYRNAHTTFPPTRIVQFARRDHRIARDTTRIDTHDRRQLLDKCQIITFSTVDSKTFGYGQTPARSQISLVTRSIFTMILRIDVFLATLLELNERQELKKF